MSSEAGIMCVVCEVNPAVLYCQQDDAHLCRACDEQVHGANLLASRHHRVPIDASHKPSNVSNERVPEKGSVFDAPPSASSKPKDVAVEKAPVKQLSFDDDDLFAVPDVDMPSLGPGDAAAKEILGKTFVSDEFDFAEMDPSWLDRLDVGLDRLPSDILDSLVPEAPPMDTAPAAAKAQSNAPEAAPPKQPAAPEAPTAVPARRAAPPPRMPVAPPTLAYPHPLSPYPPDGAHMMQYQMPRPQTPAHAPPAAQQERAAPVKSWDNSSSSGGEAPIDIDNYVPRSLLPVDQATRIAHLRARREKLERFREKKRNRHFRKTIRYASRKAYAEVRPRIKGRFARKDEVAAMRAAGILPAA